MPLFKNPALQKEVYLSNEMLTQQIRQLLEDPATNWEAMLAAADTADRDYEDAENAIAQLASVSPQAAARRRWKMARTFHVDPARRKRVARENIKRMIEVLVQVGALSRPKGTKPLAPAYWIEKLDKSHRFADLLRILFSDFAERRNRDPSLPISFFDWLTGISEVDLEDLLKAKGVGRLFREKFKKGVAYLDSLGREPYRVIVHNGLLYTAKGPLDTSNMETAFSGKGVAIFVMARDGALFVGSHIVGEFHHSSFLSGNPVRAAGELMAKEGKLVFISAKSGHYKPGPNELNNAITSLLDAGLSIAQVKVRLYKKGPDGQPTVLTAGTTDRVTNRMIPAKHSLPVYVLAVNYLRDPHVQKDYLIWGKP